MAGVLDVTEKDALACFASSVSYPFDHVLWVNLIAFRQPLHRVDPADLHLATRNYCDQLGEWLAPGSGRRARHRG